MNLAKLALQVPTVLLPQAGIDLNRWAVIACDQYTSEPEYWQAVDQLVAEQPSTLRLVFPEVYLEDEDGDARIAAINASMDQYLAEGVLAEQEKGFILLDRKTSHVESRKGLIVALDLEAYDYRPGSKTLIRATEGTIVDRLPPRIRVRENAAVELPHIMVLIDDPEQTVIEPLFEADLEQAYDFELMQSSGHLRGWKVNQPQLLEQVGNALEALADKERFQKRYDVDDEEVMLYAMGDGNHSFATAKAIWEQLKTEASDPSEVMDHPARYALIELVNVHDPGLEFEAIHRVLFDVDADDLLEQAEEYYRQAGTPCSIAWHDDLASASAAAEHSGKAHAIPFVAAGRFGVLEIADPKLTLEVGTLQNFLDAYLENHASGRIDYIHGDDAVSRFGGQKSNVGFYLPSISKHDLFRTIVRDGALPRKTFSMGEADEKRFYLEARRITC
ncbi:DUF1015 domain-containing protein [Deltaproteobacteria bacterium IMCC39524]|nr:DUF1015 domain-containing protein [Deltaproteobacteria bacterium IMCC39524]